MRERGIEYRLKKKVWFPAINKSIAKLKEQKKEFKITALCQSFDVCRQAYYKRGKKPTRKRLATHVIVSEVMGIRKRLPMLGGRKLLNKLKPRFIELEIEIGRDRFFDLLRKQELLIAPRKRYVKTTHSYLCN